MFLGTQFDHFPADVQSPNDVKPSGDMTLITDRLGLTHWDRVTPIWVSKLTIIALDNGLEPGRRQAIIWTNAGILLIGPLRANFSEILIQMQTYIFIQRNAVENVVRKLASILSRPQCVYCLSSLFFQCLHNILWTRWRHPKWASKLPGVFNLYLAGPSLM